MIFSPDPIPGRPSSGRLYDEIAVLPMSVAGHVLDYERSPATQSRNSRNLWHFPF